jgi:hypothetical protein
MTRDLPDPVGAGVYNIYTGDPAGTALWPPDGRPGAAGRLVGEVFTARTGGFGRARCAALAGFGTPHMSLAVPAQVWASGASKRLARASAMQRAFCCRSVCN